jgi:hypothetical protein
MLVVLEDGSFAQVEGVLDAIRLASRNTKTISISNNNEIKCFAEKLQLEVEQREKMKKVKKYKFTKEYFNGSNNKSKRF